MEGISHLNKISLVFLTHLEDELSAIHKIHRYLVFKTEPEKLNEIPLLNLVAIKDAFREIGETYKGETLLGQRKKIYSAYAIEKSYSKSSMTSRGMILYGPPGTGKSTLTDALPLKLGLCPISAALCASEVKRSLVGQTERLLKDLFNRATKMPHLLCCVAIDEIDGLAPKRDEKSSLHKTDALSVLFSMIEGISTRRGYRFELGRPITCLIQRCPEHIWRKTENTNSVHYALSESGS